MDVLSLSFENGLVAAKNPLPKQVSKLGLETKPPSNGLPFKYAVVQWICIFAHERKVSSTGLEASSWSTRCH
jgi:hypothetical protein